MPLQCLASPVCKVDSLFFLRPQLLFNTFILSVTRYQTVVVLATAVFSQLYWRAGLLKVPCSNSSKLYIEESSTVPVTQAIWDIVVQLLAWHRSIMPCTSVVSQNVSPLSRVAAVLIARPSYIALYGSRNAAHPEKGPGSSCGYHRSCMKVPAGRDVGAMNVHVCCCDGFYIQFDKNGCELGF